MISRENNNNTLYLKENKNIVNILFLFCKSVKAKAIIQFTIMKYIELYI
jgi:hypothetical protein